jgi:hypothetical protein
MKIYIGIHIILQLLHKQLESLAMLVSRSRVFVSACVYIYGVYLKPEVQYVKDAKTARKCG